MPTRPPHPISTDEHRPPTGKVEGRGQPALLAAFPAQRLVPLPASGVLVGRDWLASSGLNDTKVSSSHLRVTRAGGRLQIEDVSSRNGTWIDGHRLPSGEQVPLKDGAILRIGGTLLVYREAFLGPEAPAQPLGGLVGPWGLGAVRAALDGLMARFPVRLGLPPLRERPEDVFAILEVLWRRFHGPLELGRVRVDVEAVELLMQHDWPENARGLERVIAMTDPAAGLKLPVVEQVLGARASASAAPPPTREAILAALAACKENKSQAATRLGLSRPQLLRLLKAMKRRAQKV